MLSRGEKCCWSWCFQVLMTAAAGRSKLHRQLKPYSTTESRLVYHFASDSCAALRLKGIKKVFHLCALSHESFLRWLLLLRAVYIVLGPINTHSQVVAPVKLGVVQLGDHECLTGCISNSCRRSRGRSLVKWLIPAGNIIFSASLIALWRMHIRVFSPLIN